MGAELPGKHSLGGPLTHTPELHCLMKRCVQHERIVCLLGASLAPPHLCLVEELALGGSLYDLLHTGNRKKGLPYRQVS